MKGETLYEVWREERQKAPGFKPAFVQWQHLLPADRAAWDGVAKFIQDLLLRGTS